MGSADIARRHILPANAGLIHEQAESQLAVGILAEASLSYVGLGAQPPATSLGLMLRDAQAYALLKPALAIVPGLLLVLIVIALNLTGDGLRQQLDPSLRHLGGLRGSA
jgi:peptide/nickel transport system permease protein